MTRPTEQVDLLLNAFLSDMVEGRLSSRKGRSKDEITKYAENLINRFPDIKFTHTDPTSLDLSSSQNDFPETTPPEDESSSSRSSRTKIGENSKLKKAIKKLEYSDKFEQLYSSICKVSLKSHTILISVGAWSFIESLTAAYAEVISQDVKGFKDFFSKDRLNDLGFDGKKRRLDILHSLEYINKRGNASKHSPVSAEFDVQTLANNFDTVVPVLIAMAEAISVKDN